MNSKTSFTATLLLSLFCSPIVSAGEWDMTGFIGLDSQVFWQGEKFSGQESGVNTSLIVQPEFYWRSTNGRQRISAVAFARHDGHDPDRSRADLREAFWGYESGSWDINLGFNKVFWGVTESQHLVDIINQTDLVEDIDQEDKLGQPMLNVNLQRSIGRFEIYLLPWFRERTFPGEQGRFRTALTVDTDRAVYESSDEQQHVDLAFRYSHYFGDVDIGVYLFDGTSREPGFVLAPEGNQLLPVYEQITQTGVDLQYTNGSWLWKLESIVRNAASDNSFAAVGGFEYSFYGVRGSAADIGVLLEYQYDDRSSDAPPTISDNDLFVGARLAMNDANDTAVLAGASFDTRTGETFFNVEAERRFGDRLSAEIRLRAFTNSEAGDSLNVLSNDDYVQLRLSWYY